jgi:RHS repeat-associated protein
VQQTVGTSVTNYLWDEASIYGDVVLETDGSGAIQASYMLGNGQVLTETRSGVTSYYLDDGQGSVRGLTNNAGAVTDSYSYDAFGNLLTSQGTTVNPYRYTGQQFDSLTGLYDLRARYYDPTSGRFLSRDTAAIDFSSPVELNRYSYAEENPINLSDPSGQASLAEYRQLLYYIAAGAAVGGAIALAPKNSLRKLLEALAVLLGFLFGLLIHVESEIVSSTTSSHPPKKEVIIDNNALINYTAGLMARNYLLKDPATGELLEQPVTTPTVLSELKYRPKPAEVEEVPDIRDPAIEAQFLGLLKKIPSSSNDAIIGTTVVLSVPPRGLITFDQDFAKAVRTVEMARGVPVDVRP